MATVYILYSKTADKYYTGSTQNLEPRLKWHAEKKFAGSFTAQHSDWELYFEISDIDYRRARQIESHIKRMKSRHYIQNLKKYPEMAIKLLGKY
jgi:putative endonuclease